MQATAWRRFAPLPLRCDRFFAFPIESLPPDSSKNCAENCPSTSDQE